MCSTCNDDYYLDGVDEVCVACDSKEAAKQSQSASKEILPIVVGVVFTLAIVVVAAVNMPGSVQDWYNRKVERIMVRQGTRVISLLQCCHHSSHRIPFHQTR